MKSASASVIALFLSIVVQASALYVPTDAERARWTMSDMEAWATVLHAYYVDYGHYPVASTLEELRAVAEPVYISHAPIVDAWGHPYRYEPVGAGADFVLTSAGADGEFQPSRELTSGVVPSFADDAAVKGSVKGFYRRWAW